MIATLIREGGCVIEDSALITLGTNMSVVWLIAALVFLALEAATVGLFSTWFAIGSLAAMLCSFVTDNLYIQLLAFAVVSLASLIFIRPLAKDYMEKILKRSKGDTNSKVGKTVTFIEDCSEDGMARVKLGDVNWNAEVEGGFSAKKGDAAVVKAIDGNKLIVEMRGRI